MRTTTGPKNLDPYRWLEEDSPRTRDWVQARAAEAKTYFKAMPMVGTLRAELTKLFAIDTVPMPYRCGSRYFSSKRKAGQDMAVLYVQDGLNDAPRVLLDPHTFSQDHTTTLSTWVPSRDGRMLAFGKSVAGNDKESLHIMSVDTGEVFADVIPHDFYPSFSAWNQDGTGFWYTKHDPREPMDEAKLYQRLYYHALGAPWQDDAIVFGEDLQKEDLLGGGPTRDGKWFIMHVTGQDKRVNEWWTEIYIRDFRDPDSTFVRVVDRDPGKRVSGHIDEGMLYLRTNKDAPRWRILRMPVVDAMARSAVPEVLIPETAHVMKSFFIINDRIFVESMENVHSVLREYTIDGAFVREVKMPTLGSIGGYSYEDDVDELFFSFSSFAVPTTVFRIELSTDEMKVYDRAEAGFDTSSMVTEQVWYPSKDGTRIPMFLVYKKGMRRDGARPTVLYGYGGFNVSLTPGFMKSIVPFLERGGIYAIANLRGGGEFGHDWHMAGVKTKKQNVFDDFAAAATWLMHEGYTRRDRIVVSGGSNGGLLTLATVMQHPDLVGAAIADVPVADMLRFHKYFGGAQWIADYGDPDDPDMRDYLLGYSPYHNVVNGQKYPAVLIMTGAEDDRVHPMHSYKMTARLQEANASDEPIILRVELAAGHGGANAISTAIEGLADAWAFIFDQTGITK